MKNIGNWIKKNYVGMIITFMIIVIILAPSFISGNLFSWMKNCFLFRNVDFSKTGNIGDTIGGITAPFIGVLSIILLYITFREQRKFNKAQRSVNDWSVLLEMKNSVEEHSRKIHFELIYPSNQSQNKQYMGLDNIDQLNTFTNNNGSISLNDFYKLYDEVLLISDLCILFHKINNQSSLSDEIKKSLKNTIWHYSKRAGCFFVLCSERKVSIINNINTIGDDLIKNKEKQINQYIELLKGYIERSS